MKKLLALALALGVLTLLAGHAVGQMHARKDTTEAPADYLNLSAGAVANPATTIGLSWNGVSGKTYRVQWRKSSGGTWSENTVDENNPSLIIGSGNRWYYAIGNLSCNTSYAFKVKQTGRGWRNVSASTADCGIPGCQIAASNLVLNSSADHVFFIGIDKRVYNHWWDSTSSASNKWRLDALGPAQIAAGNLAVNSSTDHVFFIGIDQRVYNYWWDNTSSASNKWRLDPLGSAQIAASNLVLNSSADHVFFIGTDKRVYNYWWDNTSSASNKWRLDWLGPAQIAAGNLAVNSSSDHVFFIGTDKRVYNYWWNINKWQLDSLCT